jgi:hypothetical protein
MGESLSRKCRWWIVVIYAVAMAWVEAAVVYYLRTMFDRIDPHQSHPLPIVGGLGTAELVREAATLVMLLAVGVLSGRSWRGRLGYTAIAFGVWDIFYYVFLRVLCGWPHSLLDWDVLFLLPLPWWGPVLAPVLISSLMIVWGTLASSEEPFLMPGPGEGKAWVLTCLGVLLALYLFMADAIHAAGQGAEAVRDVLPTVFDWGWFSLALALMSAPVCLQAWRVLRHNGPIQTSGIAFPVVGNEAMDGVRVRVTNPTKRGGSDYSSQPGQRLGAAADKNVRAPDQPLRGPGL